MNTQPILIVTPTLGESLYLNQTVACVAALPLPVIHVLSVPARKVETLQARYPHARVVPDAGKAGGIYGAINAGLGAAPDGWKWFTYINDDDLLLPAFGQVAREHFAQANPEPVVYGDVELIDESSRRITRITTTPRPDWIPDLLAQGISPLMQQGMLFSHETVKRLGGFDTRYRLCADLDFWVRAFASGQRFRYYAQSIAQFRLRTGQLSGATSVTMREQDDIVACHLHPPVAPLRRRAVRLGYRLYNLPRYLARIRSSGLRTSYQLLQHGTARA
ncbi:MAG TPA: hypothetical protein VGD81_12550 [Opitutaceae bacterium]